VYYATGSFEAALDLLSDSLQLYEEIEDERLVASTLNNIGLAHARLGNNDEALAALERAVPIEERLDDRSGLALSFNNIGMVYEELGRPTDALAKYRDALALCDAIGDRQGSAIARHNVGQIQAVLGDHDTALVNLHAALDVVQELQIREIERDTYETLSSVYEQIGDTERALEFHHKFKETHDLLFDERTAGQLAQLEARLEVERKDREIALLRKNEQIQRIVRNVSLAGSVLLIALVVLLYSRYRLKSRANRALAEANEQSERAARAELAHFSRVTIMGELATVLAHELKQPLTAMMSNAQAGRRMLASETSSPAEIDDALKDIVDAAGRARDVIQRLRELIRRGEITRERLAVDAVIREIEPFARADVGQHGIRLEIDSAADLPPVSGDRVQLQQVILNLVHNGAEAMAADPDHGEHLRVRASLQDPDTVLIAVHDSGPGLGDEPLERMFEPFFTKKTDGLGMGLPICQSIVEAHGGRLWAERNPDRGLVVQFTVPRAGSK
jgi:C4-dicarboxylate-specific signal transduction histidine kinase